MFQLIAHFCSPRGNVIFALPAVTVVDTFVKVELYVVLELVVVKYVL
jgi:hypothetical protein